ncbi:MAG: aminopeptidase N [Hyphomicrobiaceae bacterium]
MKTDTPRPIRLKDYRPPSFLIDQVRLDVVLHPTETIVRARLDLRRNPGVHKSGDALVLDGEHLELVSIDLDGARLGAHAYKIDDRSLTLIRPPAGPFRLEIVTRINPEANKALQGLYRSRGVYCTQCEAQGFRRITYFLDRPDVLATYTTRIEADRAEVPVLLSNGNPIERGTLAGGRRHYVVWQDPHPKPCYLFALVGGDLAAVSSTFRTASGRKVDLGIYVEPGKQERAHWAMDALKRSMRWDETRFGLEYDLDVFNVVAVSDFNLGAMENKGLNIFNDRLILASPETATDAIFEAIESVVAHEYFHNWTGNRITCRDWFQLCLKEGLTVYRDQEFSADERSPTVQRITDVRQLRSFQFPEDQGPLAHPVRPDSYIEINNFYTATVYEKGAELVRMIETTVGAKAFQTGMDLYLRRHDGQAATVEDFISAFETASGRDLGQFRLWYAQAGTPELVCDLAYDARAKTAALTVEQVLAPTPGQPTKKPLHIPIRLGLIGGNGQDLPLELDDGTAVDDGVVHLTAQRQTFTFTGIASRPVPSLLRGFSAPVRLTIDTSDRELAFRMACDSDLFNRWQAANDYATRILLQLVRRPDDDHGVRISAFASALGATISRDEVEPAYAAELLKLPSEADIAREIGRNVDADAIHAARRAMLKEIGRQLARPLGEIYLRMSESGPFSPDAASAGRRALRNVALTLLTARDGRADRARLVAHYETATNMTDQAHALFLLAAKSGQSSRDALADFYDRWKNDHVVIDTWFSAQAMSPASATVSRVRALTRHPLFAYHAPNKVRALIGSFALQNAVQFNRADGAGYAFVADQILEIDRFNPQVAARLLGAFRSWRSLKPDRRKLAKAELVRIAKASNLSRDAYEIVTKILEKPEG